MTEKQLLLGSLSNDLLRVANLTFRGSTVAAHKFMLEAKKWAAQLEDHKLKEYIAKIVQDVLIDANLTQDRAERLLMYSILLQNYTLKNN